MIEPDNLIDLARGQIAALLRLSRSFAEPSEVAHLLRDLDDVDVGRLVTSAAAASVYAAQLAAALAASQAGPPMPAKWLN